VQLPSVEPECEAAAAGSATEIVGARAGPSMLSLRRHPKRPGVTHAPWSDLDQIGRDLNLIPENNALGFVGDAVSWRRSRRRGG
jgi:hypothetical protein